MLFRSGADWDNHAEMQTYATQIAKRIEALGLKGVDAAHLIHLYGNQTDEILKHAELHPEPDPEIGLALAELWFAMNHEMVARAEDFLIRRTGLLYFNLHRLIKVEAAVLEAMATQLQWSSERITSEKTVLKESVHNATTFE